jgi:hypothetical protein
VTLDHEDLQAIRTLLQEILAEPAPAPDGYLDAHTWAKRLGRNVEVVRRNAVEYGGVKIAGRWYFDPKAPKPNQEQPTPRAPRHRPRKSTTPLLPIR